VNAKSIKSYLLAGLVVWLPLLITFVVLQFIVGLLDKTLALIPKAYQPAHLIGFNIPGLGIVLSFIILICTGFLVTNYLGQRLVVWGELLLARIPLVRSIYNAAKKVIHALLTTNSDAFRKVLLVQYPREGMWSLAFQTGVVSPAISDKDMISLFIPTTPNPTSGFLMMVQRGEVIELEMTPDEALKYIISLGVMQPGNGAAAPSLHM
jgi:uncharacterized membrane protein